LLLASGSEVRLCLEAYEQLTVEGIQARVVSMPWWELFDDQPQAYRDHVLPLAVLARVVEQASTFGWERYIAQQDTSSACGRSGHRRCSRSCRRNSGSSWSRW
jgi:transketolase